MTDNYVSIKTEELEGRALIYAYCDATQGFHAGTPALSVALSYVGSNKTKRRVNANMRRAAAAHHGDCADVPRELVANEEGDEV